MLVDAAEWLGNDPDVDVVVVGAGVNGAILAAQLDGAGVRVALLEAGALAPGPGDDRWTAEVAGQPFIGANIGRRKGFGGSGAWWAGQCAPFDPIDLDRRGWVEHSDWPIGWAELAAWYPEAARVLGIAGESFTEAQWKARGIAPVPELEHKFSAFLPRPDIARSLLPQLTASANVVVVTGLRVRRIVRDPESGRVGGVEVLLGPGRSGSIAASTVVLTAGGVESARVILASATASEPGGVGNPHDVAGRFLHDHPNGITARIEPFRRRRFDDLYGMLYAPRSRDRTRNWARIPLPAAVQRELRVVNALGNVDFEDDATPLGAVKRLVRHVRGSRPLGEQPGRGELLAGAVRGLPAVPGVAWRRYARGLSPVHPSGNVWLRVSAEQPPRPGSRVTLSGRADDWGVPLASIEWTLGDDERRAQQALTGVVAAAWERAGLARVTPMPWLADEEQWCQHQVDALHHSGTLRMASSPWHGVVGPDLECHDLGGLFVAGSAVFPTSSSANPTFTSVALTMRLSHHLRQNVLRRRARIQLQDNRIH